MSSTYFIDSVFVDDTVCPSTSMRPHLEIPLYSLSSRTEGTAPHSRHCWPCAVRINFQGERDPLQNRLYMSDMSSPGQFYDYGYFEVLSIDSSWQISVPSLRVKYSKKNSRSAKLRRTKSQKSKDLKYTARGKPEIWQGNTRKHKLCVMFCGIF